MQAISSPEKSNELKQSADKKKKIFYGLLAVLAIAIIAAGVDFSLPHLVAGGKVAAQFLQIDWAKDYFLISQLIYTTVMLWCLASALFWGGWLLRRSIRKLRGVSWRVPRKNEAKPRFFPPVILYLKISCIYLFLVLIYVVSQYPIQYIILDP